MTEVYAFDMDAAALPEEAAALLPRWRYERWARLRYAPARRESLAAGLLYAWAMGQRGADPAAEVTLLPAGKPVREDVFFSLSHSGRYVLCAVGERSVGADVQLIRKVRPTVARRFHPGEQAWLTAQEDWEGSFFRLWARKEAWVKAVSGPRTLTLDEADVTRPLPGLWFRDFTLPGGYAAAVCAEAAEISDIRWATAAELLGSL